MTYTVHSVFRTIQGEGGNVGRIAVLCRFAGCNLWTGREQDRATATCRFCDTEFRGGEKYATPHALVRRLRDEWPDTSHRPRFVVFTGGEPLLQLDAALTELCHVAGFYVAVETNGTQPRPPGIDWLTVSPKANAPLVLDRADELKVVFPQEVDPAVYDGFDARLRWLQPMDGPHLTAHTRAAIDYCQGDPRWRLSVQMHKVVGVP
jgi:7-carboxy-7-deazaguanine synthase